MFEEAQLNPVAFLLIPFRCHLLICYKVSGRKFPMIGEQLSLKSALKMILPVTKKSF
jgi:hypothetical protein